MWTQTKMAPLLIATGCMLSFSCIHFQPINPHQEEMSSKFVITLGSKHSASLPLQVRIIIFDVEALADFVADIGKRVRRRVVEIELSEIARDGINFKFLKQDWTRKRNLAARHVRGIPVGVGEAVKFHWLRLAQKRYGRNEPHDVT